MIFIILGSQKFQFNRILKEIDRLCENGTITDQVFAQIGYSDYKPRHFEFKEFLDRDEFDDCVDGADIIITHAGTGSVIGAIKKGKKVIAIPRLLKYGEHIDNHQVQLVKEMRNSGYICGIVDCSKIADAIEYVNKKNFRKYNSNANYVINSIESFIKSMPND